MEQLPRIVEPLLAVAPHIVHCLEEGSPEVVIEEGIVFVVGPVFSESQQQIPRKCQKPGRT